MPENTGLTMATIRDRSHNRRQQPRRGQGRGPGKRGGGRSGGVIIALVVVGVLIAGAIGGAALYLGRSEPPAPAAMVDASPPPTETDPAEAARIAAEQAADNATEDRAEFVDQRIEELAAKDYLPWAQFKSDRVDFEAGRFRVFGELTDYYNFWFQGRQAQFISITITDLPGSRQVTGYLDRTHPLADAVREYLADGEPGALEVAIRFMSQARDTSTVLIEDIQLVRDPAKDWIDADPASLADFSQVVPDEPVGGRLPGGL